MSLDTVKPCDIHFLLGAIAEFYYLETADVDIGFVFVKGRKL